jgi:hypothetical protein
MINTIVIVSLKLNLISKFMIYIINIFIRVDYNKL